MTFPRKFKYVIIADLYPRICSEAETHRELSGGQVATSAGFATLSFEKNELEVSTYGESVSLKLKSNPSDAALIKRMFVETY